MLVEVTPLVLVPAGPGVDPPPKAFGALKRGDSIVAGVDNGLRKQAGLNLPCSPALGVKAGSRVQNAWLEPERQMYGLIGAKRSLRNSRAQP